MASYSTEHYDRRRGASVTVNLALSNG